MHWGCSAGSSYWGFAELCPAQVELFFTDRGAPSTVLCRAVLSQISLKYAISALNVNPEKCKQL